MKNNYFMREIFSFKSKTHEGRKTENKIFRFLVRIKYKKVPDSNKHYQGRNKSKFRGTTHILV